MLVGARSRPVEKNVGLRSSFWSFVNWKMSRFALILMVLFVRVIPNPVLEI